VIHKGAGEGRWEQDGTPDQKGGRGAGEAVIQEHDKPPLMSRDRDLRPETSYRISSSIAPVGSTSSEGPIPAPRAALSSLTAAIVQADEDTAAASVDRHCTKWSPKYAAWLTVRLAVAV